MRCAKCLKVVYRWQIVRNVRGWAHCPFCKSRMCRLCGCTNERACRGGCSWNEFDPSVCSTHSEEEIAAAA